jgi:hypothetical protein
MDGTRYYVTGECFLFLMRLLQQCGDMDLHARFKPILNERVAELVGTPGDAAALAMRVMLCEFLGVENESEIGVLLSLQCKDGGWEVGWIYRYGSSGTRIGNRGLVTALALKAIESVERTWVNSDLEKVPTTAD